MKSVEGQIYSKRYGSSLSDSMTVKWAQNLHWNPYNSLTMMKRRVSWSRISIGTSYLWVLLFLLMRTKCQISRVYSENGLICISHSIWRSTVQSKEALLPQFLWQKVYVKASLIVAKLFTGEYSGIALLKSVTEDYSSQIGYSDLHTSWIGG